MASKACLEKRNLPELEVCGNLPSFSTVNDHDIINRPLVQGCAFPQLLQWKPKMYDMPEPHMTHKNNMTYIQQGFQIIASNFGIWSLVLYCTKLFSPPIIVFVNRSSLIQTLSCPPLIFVDGLSSNRTLFC